MKNGRSWFEGRNMSLKDSIVGKELLSPVQIVFVLHTAIAVPARPLVSLKLSEW